tara:strand:- start:4388 stop:5296 length:909 start_codon:yes stop_codon:yes gene_type:complete
MVNTIVLKSSNITDTTKNSTFKYDFPNSINFKDMELGLISASLYYSWFNISDELGNRIFQYKLYNATATAFETITITLDEGLYEIGDLNKALQFAFIEKGFYLVDTNGDNIYFAEFLVNSVKNSVDIVTYAVPDVTTSGYTAPSGWDYYNSGGTYYPQIIIPTTSTFNEIIGYPSGYQSQSVSGATAFTPITANSTTAPNVNPNSSVLVEVNIVDNPYGIPANIIYAIVPNVGVGSLIYVAPPEYAFVPIRDGVYNGLTLRLLNKDSLEPLTIQDSQITIILGIKEKYSYENTVRDVNMGKR